MGKKSLVISSFMSKDMEFAGRFLLKELQKQRLAIDAAMWFFYPEMSTWKYILVMDDFEEKGPAFLYNIISQINRNHKSSRYHEIPLDMVEAKGKSSFIYKVMRSVISLDSGEMRFTNNMVNGLEIADCLIYRMK